MSNHFTITSYCLIFLFSLFMSMPASSEEKMGQKQRKAKKASDEKIEKGLKKEKKRSDCGWGNSDGQSMNAKSGVIVHLGPPGAQNGQPNPLGLPPGPQDVQVTYLHRCGIEGNLGLVPGLTGGVRYRAGSFFYGSIGGGLLLTANAMGPGLYTALGATFAREWPVTFEMEFRQGLGIGFGNNGAQLINPYAFRLGAGVYW